MTDTKNADLANNAGFGSRSSTEPPAVDMERQPQPAQAPEVTSDENTVPPARMGQASQAVESPTEGDPDDNPVHHKGHMPPPVTGGS